MPVKTVLTQHEPKHRSGMTKMYILCIGIFILASAQPPAVEAPRIKLSEYALFEQPLARLKPAPRVFPYAVNAPLFSDYAEKARFIYLPEGQSMQYHSEENFSFPEGAIIIKHFYYFTSPERRPSERRLLETRLLIREKQDWKALSYIWNEAQTDAFLEVAGATLPVAWYDEKGNKNKLDYVAPNQNQCKGCHSIDGRFTPIGISSRQLNRTETVEQGPENQLTHWASKGYLLLPDGFSAEAAPKLADYREAGDLNLRARAYLDANCAHCHNPQGPASTSGLFLEASQTDPTRLGILKTPVAAGRGSGKRKYGIVPGKPAESILLYRMESDDPGIRMPEIGRQIPHREGIELIKAWIKTLP